MPMPPSLEDGGFRLFAITFPHYGESNFTTAQVALSLALHHPVKLAQVSHMKFSAHR